MFQDLVKSLKDEIIGAIRQVTAASNIAQVTNTAPAVQQAPVQAQPAPVSAPIGNLPQQFAGLNLAQPGFQFPQYFPGMWPVDMSQSTGAIMPTQNFPFFGGFPQFQTAQNLQNAFLQNLLQNVAQPQAASTPPASSNNTASNNSGGNSGDSQNRRDDRPRRNFDNNNQGNSRRSNNNNYNGNYNNRNQDNYRGNKPQYKPCGYCGKTNHSEDKCYKAQKDNAKAAKAAAAPPVPAAPVVPSAFNFWPQNLGAVMPFFTNPGSYQPGPYPMYSAPVPAVAAAPAQLAIQPAPALSPATGANAVPLPQARTGTISVAKTGDEKPSLDHDRIEIPESLPVKDTYCTDMYFDALFDATPFSTDAIVGASFG